MAKLNLTQAAKIAGVSVNTLKKHMAAGRLSWSVNDSGNKVIDAAELVRVYDTHIEQPEQTAADHLDNPLVAALQQQIEYLKEENARERVRTELLQNKIETLEFKLERTGELLHKYLPAPASTPAPEPKKSFWKKLFS